jgi:hypothetical protein
MTCDNVYPYISLIFLTSADPQHSRNIPKHIIRHCTYLVDLVLTYSSCGPATPCTRMAINCLKSSYIGLKEFNC